MFTVSGVRRLKVLTERPLTANVTAENLNDAVTPANRLFIRNNLLTRTFRPRAIR